ncbi:MAG: hypothetical protein RSC68_14765, partial [Acinetobacter sp.]
MSISRKQNHNTENADVATLAGWPLLGVKGNAALGGNNDAVACTYDQTQMAAVINNIGSAVENPINATGAVPEMMQPDFRVRQQ